MASWEELAEAEEKAGEEVVAEEVAEVAEEHCHPLLHLVQSSRQHDHAIYNFRTHH